MRITMAGGDSRMITAGQLLQKAGYNCAGFGFGERDTGFPLIEHHKITEALAQTDAVILPLPCQRDGYLNTPFTDKRYLLADVFAAKGPETIVLGGLLPTEGKNFIDYSLREDFRIKNAVPTAEGAISLAMSSMDRTLFGAKAVVVGYGRIGKYLSLLLKSMSASVTVVARSLHSRATAEINGLTAVGFDDFGASLTEAQVVFNTVPHLVITEKEIAVMKEGCLLIDLASLPGGVDEGAAQSYGIKFLRALSLPGKVAPVTAGRIVFETVYSILRERGIAI